MKKTTKKTTKKIAYTVDLTNCTDAADMRIAFIAARAANKQPVTIDDIIFIEENAYHNGYVNGTDLKNVFVKLFELDAKFIDAIKNYGCRKKDPWYKRLWNKLFGKKK